jgi:hypothetical protein
MLSGGIEVLGELLADERVLGHGAIKARGDKVMGWLKSELQPPK